MKIDTIFGIVGRNLIAVKFEGIKFDEFERLFDNWTDIEWLYQFFQENIEDITGGFYGRINIEEAIERTIEEAEKLEQKLIEIAELGQIKRQDNLQILFRPLDNNDYRLKDLQKSKAYGHSYNSWLRIYAIRIAENVYVVSGGAIKLTATMNEREYLKLELEKLQITKDFLIEKGLIDEDDFEFLELK